MNAVRFIWFDIKNGIAKQWRNYVVSCIILALLAFSLVLSAKGMSQMTGKEFFPLSLADYLVNVVAGMKRYVFDPSNPFSFPAAWFLVLLQITYLTLNYPYRNLMGVGKHLIILSGSRRIWWFSKCVWVVLSVSAFFALGFIVAVFAAVISGGELTLTVSAVTPDALMFDSNILNQRPWNIAGLLVLMPVMTIALCLIQLLLSLIVKPMISYICTIVILFLSAYFQSSWLIGNYLMAARSASFVSCGMSWQIGLEIGAVIIIVVIISGTVFFKRMDILDLEHSL